MNTFKRLAALCTLALPPLAASAQQISSILVQPADPQPGQRVVVRVFLEIRDAPAGCGLKVAMGDGGVRQMRADLTTMPITFTYTYTRAGKFLLRAQGAAYVRGLHTALACSGSTTTQVNVVDIAAQREAEAREVAERRAFERAQAAERAAQAREREQREAAARAIAEQRQALEAQAARNNEAAQREDADRERLEAQARALKEREAEVQRVAEQRERELARRAESLRRQERELEARERALEAKEKTAKRSTAPTRTAAKESPASSTGASKAPEKPASPAAQKPSPEPPSSKPAPKPEKPPARTGRGTLDAF